LFDSFTEYVKQCKDERKSEAGNKAVFPCILDIVPDSCFNTKNPIILGVNVIEGQLRIGTLLCIPTKENLRLGLVTSIEANKKPLQTARASNGSVAIKIASTDSIQYGRHFD
jgi:translation initiation factor 5B